MPLKESVTDVIQRRSSCRTYKPEPLTSKQEAAIRQHLQEKRTGPFGLGARFVLLSRQPEDVMAAKRIGTYGTIAGARQYIVGLICLQDKALENFGYLMEETILFATALDLGTCWLGGSLHRSQLSQETHAAPEEYIPAMTPVGQASGKRSWTDHLLRWSARAKARKPWTELFFLSEFGRVLTRENAARYALPLEMVRLGPSASNRQPWRVVKDADRENFHFYLQRNALYGNIAKTLLQAEDIQRLDLGIAMCHFEKTAQALKLSGKWELISPIVKNLPPNTEYIVSWRGNDK
ncbi:nitroreductase [candidate division FCPU426 bacterium]|nr:nitroreductase [candidate division FCPU426 bacterium]